MGEFLIVKIKVSVSKPFARGRLIKLKDRSIWIAFHYEKIPKFCFWCGVIRHGRWGCSKSGPHQLQGDDNDTKFGPWLRATSPKRWWEKG